MSRENDAGYKKIVSALKSIDRRKVAVGIFADAKAKRDIVGDDSDYLALRYKWNDEGTKHIPKRPTLNPAINKAFKTDLAIAGLFKNLDKKGSVGALKDLRFLGTRLADSVKKEIVELKDPPNSPRTIQMYLKRYGQRRDNPLIRTGDMRQAVEYRFVK